MLKVFVKLYNYQLLVIQHTIMIVNKDVFLVHMDVFNVQVLINVLNALKIMYQVKINVFQTVVMDSQFKVKKNVMMVTKMVMMDVLVFVKLNKVGVVLVIILQFAKKIILLDKFVEMEQ